MKNNNFKIQFKEVIKLSTLPLILIIISQLGHINLVRQTILESKSQTFEIVAGNPLSLYLFPLVCSVTISIILQTKKRNNSMVYEYFRCGKKTYFKDLFLSVSLLNLGIIIVGNIIAFIISYIIFAARPDLVQLHVTDKVTMLRYIRTSSVLTLIFYILQQWFVSLIILGFSFVVNLATSNLFLGFFASTIYLLITEATYLIIDINLLDLSLAPTYLPGIKMQPFPENIFQLEFGLIPLLIVTVLIYFFNKKKIEEV
ncbi:hypothetical protein [Lagierella sp.]|uniref:hypothetical protein n=1 Tax=Lagierella sp. TaxID=2849657 RepID=UPI0026276891|nr:hypothetical protein [Lagierella sp.]